MQQGIMEQEVVQGYRPSPQQKRVWLLQQQDGQGTQFGAYRAACMVEISGAVRDEVLHEALHSVVERHEILRTSFRCLRGMSYPLQVIGESGALEITQLDLSDRNADEQELRIARLFEQERTCSSDVQHQSLLRATLVRQSQTNHVLILSLPAICIDNVGMSRLVDEIAHSYTACSTGKEMLDEPPQYADLSEILNELLESEETRAGRDYWQQQHFRAIPQPHLPFLRRTPSRSPIFSPSRLSLPLSDHLSARVAVLCAAAPDDLPAFLLACWQALLWRLTDEPELVIGTAFDGRTDEDVRLTLGLFTRYLPLRARPRAELRFSDLWRQAEESSVEAAQWQDYFTWEQSEAEELEASYLRMAFEHECRAAKRDEGQGVSFGIGEQYVCTDRFDLKLHCIAEGERLRVELHYDSSLYDEADAARLLEQYETVAESAASNVETPLRELEVMGEAERRQVLEQWNETEVDYGEINCLHEMFAAQVEQTPDAVAVSFDGEEMTYQELEARANQLAHHLLTLGVRAEARVGICVERSLEMIVGLLGILKAGGAYVPLDPEYPQERLAFMLADSEVSVLLTHSSLLDALPSHQAQVLCLDTDWPLIAEQRTECPGLSVLPENAAYVIYTSGSTGRPKGVIIPHRAISNHMLWMQHSMPLSAADRVLQKTPLSFDASVWEFYAPLLCGARLVIAAPGIHRDSAALVEVMRDEGVTVVQVVPSMLRLLVEEEGIEGCESLRRVCCGGEALSEELVSRFKQRVRAELYNLYGPTEATIDASMWRAADDAERVTIGRPISNARMYVVDERMRAVPVGVAGELLIGGEGLGRGYLKRAELTAEKFVPNPFSREEGERLYRTGDLVRYMVDGELEYLGRIDHQVKVRGFRIELGEIETALEADEGVRQAVVIAREEAGGTEKRLVAYVVSEGGAEQSVGELRSHLKEKLPEYMMPSAFVMMDELPLMPNGKVDRQALPAPEQKRGEGDAGYVAPQTPTEEMLAGIWAEVLGLERVGLDDNFFELGGHSLLATQVIARVRKAFQTEVELNALFEAPTVAGLAAHVEEQLRAGAGLESAPIIPVSREEVLPLSFAQQRLWFLDQLEPGTSAYNMPAAVRLRGDLDVTALERTLSEVVRRHEVLRTTFETHDEQPQQVIHPPSPVSLEVTDLTDLSQDEREVVAQRLAAEESRRPFDLSRGPLLRASLLRLGEQDHMVLFTLHHIVSDGWSMGVLVREVAALYEAYAKGEESPLEELSIQYADYAGWQRQRLQGEVLEEQLGYWKRQLSNLPVLELPTDRPRPAVQSFNGAYEKVELGKELSEGLKGLSRREGATLFMTLMAGWQALLFRYTGQDDISVGSFIANRNRAETEALIGFFLNNLALRTDLSGNPSFRELLGRVREVALGAYLHQDLPFELVLEATQPERDASRTRLFQVMFVLQNTPKQSLALPGLRLSSMEAKNPRSNFDLTLWMWETPTGLGGAVEYNTDLFEAATIARMVGHLETLLEGIVAHPEERIGQLPLMSEVERRQLLVEWNDTTAEYEQERHIHELIEAQAARIPDATAVVFEDRRLTYGELNAWANRVARRLRGLGVGPEVKVGICMERSVEMVVGALAVLKAGGAYVPLDPSYPTERLIHMMQDSRAPVLLTQQRLLRSLPDHDMPTLALDSESELLADESEENLDRLGTSNNLAYVIYTSGSTQRPRGAMISHRSLVNAYRAWENSYALASEVKCSLQTASFAFDVFTGDLVRALCSGGKLVICPGELLLSAPHFYELMRREEVDGVEVVPAILRNLIQYLEETGQSLDFMRLIVAGSDIWYYREFEQAKRFCGPRTRLINSYGLTESTIDSTYFECTQLNLPPGKVAPIGRPFANTRVYILDRNFEPVPIGVVGELYVGGPGLARGYLNHPDLTAAKFIPDPFNTEDGARLYKTGDVARYLTDGNIEFLGRSDYQVKVRGFRIELEEIETVLASHPNTRQTVVLAREDAPGEKRLVAYIVPREEPAPPASELRGLVKEHLPAYMIPSAFVMLEALPLTPNGKIDRRALPAPDFSRVEEQDTYVEPATEVEILLAEIWSEVLGIEKIGIYDNFFETGGHSLLATQVIARVRKTFQVEIPLRSLFESPTIAELAVAVEEILLDEIEDLSEDESPDESAQAAAP